MKHALVFFFAFSVFVSFSQPNYLIYDTHGNQKSAEDVLSAALSKRYVFFGELHGQAESHTLQLFLLQGLVKQKNAQVVLGMEMFESDVQVVVDEYFSNLINQRSFESESRVWTNYKDYRPIVEYAKENGIPLIATNIPRRYANAVYHQGLDVLDRVSGLAKSWFPVLPMEVDTTLKSYRLLREMMPDHRGVNMLYSQAVKDWTMAHRILENASENKVFLHLNGGYHTDDREGILSFMKHVPAQDILVITTVMEADFAKNRSDYLRKADFILLSKESSVK